MAQFTPILTNQTINGSASVTTNKLAPDRRHDATVYVTGTFAGASVQLALSLDNVNFVALGLPITQNAIIPLPYNANFIQATVTGAGATTDISASVL